MQNLIWNRKLKTLLVLVSLSILCVQGNAQSSYPVKSNLQFNPLGFVQFGPIIQAEIAIAPNFVLFPHARFAGLGLLSHLSVDYDEFDVSSMAFGGGFRVLPGRGKHRPYAGALVEYGWGTGQDSGGGYYNAAKYRHSYVSVIGNGRFRWRFSKLIMQAGAYVGAVIETEDVRTDVHVDYGTDVLFIAMLEFGIGFEF